MAEKKLCALGGGGGSKIYDIKKCCMYTQSTRRNTEFFLQFSLRKR